MSERTDSVDIVVVGSGAAALSAAVRAADLGASVLVLEKSDKYGGSTAMSGGVCWVANNPWIARTGISDSDEDGLTYLKHITRGEVAEERLRAYLEGSKRVVSYLEEHSDVRFDPLKHYTDYYPEAPGGRPGGRSMESRPYDGTQLGGEFGSLRLPHPQSQIMGKFGITAGQANGLLIPTFKAKLLILWYFFRYALRFFKRRRFGRDTHLVTGNALIARLRVSLMKRDVPLWLNTEVTGLVREGGRTVGVEAERDGEPVMIGARRGVILAAGGFERNLVMREQHQPKPTSTEWTAANLHNVGDGIRMGVEAGGKLELMDEAWWTPTTLVPGSDLAWVLVVEKNLPGGIFVDQHAKRYTNEAAPYIDVVNGMYGAADESGSTVPSFLVFDARYRKNYPVGPIAPGYAQPRVSRRYSEFLLKSSTIEGLAEKCGLDPEALRQTVERFNGMARKGTDEDFGRGKSASDRYYGDFRVKPNPSLAPLENAPFYAIRVYPGDLGTKGGLVTDVSSRVLDESDRPVPGLFAAGNCTASIMGRTYPGAGGTIGPAITFGFIAAETACEVDWRRDTEGYVVAVPSAA